MYPKYVEYNKNSLYERAFPIYFHFCALKAMNKFFSLSFEYRILQKLDFNKYYFIYLTLVRRCNVINNVHVIIPLRFFILYLFNDSPGRPLARKIKKKTRWPNRRSSARTIFLRVFVAHRSQEQ